MPTVQAVSNGKDTTIVEQNPNNSTVEVISHPEPTLSETVQASPMAKTVEVISHPEPTMTETGQPSPISVKEIVGTDEPIMIERIVAR